MMTRKSLFSLLLSAVLLFGLAACSTASPDTSAPAESRDGASSAETESPASSADATDPAPSVPDSPAETTGTTASAGSRTDRPQTSATVRTTATVRATKNSGSSSATRVFKVESYGAKGDGKTNDGPAIAKAVEAACRDGSAHKVVELKANATYRVTSNGVTDNAFLLLIGEADNLTVKGSNTRLLMKAPMRVCRVSDSQNITLSGIIVDYSPKPYAVGSVKAVSGDCTYFDVTCADDLGFTGTVTPSNQDYFLFRNKKDERMHVFISKMVKNSDGSYRIYINQNRTSTALIRSNLPVGMELILPVYGSAHLQNGILQVMDTDTFTLQDVRINAAPDFVFGMRRCTGRVTFKNVRLEPAAGSPPLVSWRDGFHIKDNTAKIVWDNCYIGPLGDDAINLSSVIGIIDSANTSTGIINMTPAEDTADRAGLINPGDEIVIYDLKGGKDDAVYCKIQSVIHTSGNNIAVKVDADLSKIDSINSRVVGFYAYNKGYEINNCTIEGTVRLRSSGTIKNTKFDVFWVRIENESAVEGPIPKDITFTGCTFSTPYSNPNTPVLVVNTQRASGASARFRVKNIVCNSCTFIGCTTSNTNDLHELKLNGCTMK